MQHQLITDETIYTNCPYLELDEQFGSDVPHDNYRISIRSRSTKVLMWDDDTLLDAYVQALQNVIEALDPR